MTESEKWLKNVLDKPDITSVTPGRKDHRYLGKVDGKSQYVQKQYLMWTLNDLLNIATGSSLIKKESSFEFSFGKKQNFMNMYTIETFHSRPAFANMRECLFRCKSFE